MPIRVKCDCGRTLNLKDELAGKRVKCPDCKASLTVGESGSGARKKKAAGDGEKKGGNGMLFALLGVGALVLGCCCFSGAGVGAWWFWPGGSSALEKKIVGRWVSDIEPPKKGAKPEDMFKQLEAAGMIEFKADGTVLDASPMTPILQGKWKTVSSSGDVITVEVSDAQSAKKLDIKVVSNDNLKITPVDLKKEFAFKRAK